MKRLYFGCALVAAAAAISCASRQRAAVRPAPTAMERQIRNAVDAGDGDYRTRVLRQRVLTEPDNLEVRLELVAVYRERGLTDLAVEHCRLAASRFPESVAIQLELAKGLRTAGMRREAVAGLESFLKTHPQASPKYLSWVGILWDEMEQWAEGEKAHRAALAISPESDYLRNNLGYNLLLRGKHREAVAEFREALKIDPNSQVARNNLGLSLANTGGNEQAVRQWQAGTDPATAHSNLAAHLIEQGRFEEARKELDVALGYNKRHLAALKNLELVSRMDGRPATMPASAEPAGKKWDRFRGSVRKLFVGPLQEQPAGATPVASGN